MSCAKSVLPAYMAVSTGKPARLPCHSVQVDTAHLPPQTQSISRSPRHDPSVNRTAEISNDVILCPIGLVPRHRESPQVVANQGESDPARPVNQFQVRLSASKATLPTGSVSQRAVKAAGVTPMRTINVVLAISGPIGAVRSFLPTTATAATLLRRIAEWHGLK